MMKMSSVMIVTMKPVTISSAARDEKIGFLHQRIAEKRHILYRSIDNPSRRVRENNERHNARRAIDGRIVTERRRATSKMEDQQQRDNVDEGPKDHNDLAKTVPEKSGLDVVQDEAPMTLK
jgi:hypothetical protein